MTPDERNMLTELANKIAQTPAPPRDPEAEDLIRTQIGKRPDALYLMTQTVLIQNMALQQAQKQIQELQQNRGSSNAAAPDRFWVRILLLRAGSSNNRNILNPQQYAPQASAPVPSGMPSGAPSFLRGAAQTAAGVAAGALAFEGIQSLFSHHGYGGGSGFEGFGGGGFGDRPMEETVVNNYYDSPGGSAGGNDLNLGDNRDRNSFADTGNYDDANVDNSSDLDVSDDSGGGFDDSGSDFS